MSRRRRAEKRAIIPDPVYGSPLLSKFINKVMIGGKKSTAQRVVYGALWRAVFAEAPSKSDTELSEGVITKVMEFFTKVIENIRPSVEVKSRRVGGATYQVPMEVSADRRRTLALRWILSAARERAGKSFPDKLASELIDASNETGAAIRKRDETHKMAEANRAFSHYRV